MRREGKSLKQSKNSERTVDDFFPLVLWVLGLELPAWEQGKSKGKRVHEAQDALGRPRAKGRGGFPLLSHWIR